MQHYVGGNAALIGQKFAANSDLKVGQIPRLKPAPLTSVSVILGARMSICSLILLTTYYVPAPWALVRNTTYYVPALGLLLGTL